MPGRHNTELAGLSGRLEEHAGCDDTRHLLAGTSSPAQVRQRQGNILIFGGQLAAAATLSVDTNCVTTIYLLSLLFLCHCDLDFDVKEAEKSTLIRNWIGTRQRVDNAINNNFVDCRHTETSQVTSH